MKSKGRKRYWNWNLAIVIQPEIKAKFLEFCWLNNIKFKAKQSRKTLQKYLTTRSMM